MEEESYGGNTLIIPVGKRLFPVFSLEISIHQYFDYCYSSLFKIHHL